MVGGEFKISILFENTGINKLYTSTQYVFVNDIFSFMQ